VQPMHAEGILLPGHAVSCWAGTGQRIMTYTDIWVNLIRLLVYNKHASMGPGTVRSPAQQPLEPQAAAWLQGRAGGADPRGHLPLVCL